MRHLLFVLFCIVFLQLSAQQTAEPSSEIFQKIQKLNVLGSVLYIAAHPDDENTRLIAWLSNEKLYRTAYLSMTRGDGGQNLIGDEQGVELGLIRTQELLAARKIDGGEQFFTRAFDFGYSKNPQETFQIWGREKILSDVVWIIRKFRPDVIITRFPTTGEGGHGHHTASAILAGEAFEAAADSTRFPEQLRRGVTTWQPVRLLWNTFNFGSTNTTSPDQFQINAGGYIPLLGESLGEIAAHSRSQHKSQGFGVSASRGVQPEYFKTIKGPAPVRSLFDGVDISWSRLKRPDIAQLINKIERDFSFEHPEESLTQLVNLYETVSALPDNYWKDQKLKEIKNIISSCAGLFMEAFSRTQFLLPGKDAPLTFSINNRLGANASLEKLIFNTQPLLAASGLPADSTLHTNVRLHLPENQPISQPYWLVKPMTKGSFTVDEQQLIGKPQNDPLTVTAFIRFGKTVLSYPVPVRYKYNDPVKGEVYQPVFVVPAAEIRSVPEIALSKNKTPVQVQTIITKNDSLISLGKVISKFGDAVTRKSNGYIVNKKNETETVDFSVTSDTRVYDQYKVIIEYPHIPDIIYFPHARTKLVGVDIQTAGSKAGYIPGAGDKIPEALKQLGYSVTTLGVNDFSAQRLKQFDVIVAGVRAYNIHEWLNDVYPVLMDYVRDGGVLFVQYNTNNNLGPVKAKIGPYKFDISRTRVTNEDAPVTFTDAQSTLLTYPNVITTADFSGWIQERSTYHAGHFQKHYKTLFSMHDPGENPDEGSLIYADYGKGRFIYSGLVFFRELPAGNPGAYRLFANLIAKPKS